MVYTMVSDGILIPIGANKNKTYQLAKKNK